MNDTSESIERVVQKVLRSRMGDEVVDDTALKQRYSELMPQLGERLRDLRQIRAAAAGAQARHATNDLADDEAVMLCEHILREGLKGYKLLCPIHRGGQGVVFRACQCSTKRTVAIKVLHYGPFATERQRRRFEREIELASRLDHPNIVAIHESGVVRGLHYFAMALVEGLAIDDYVILQQPTLRRIVELVLEVCRTISYAHQQGIIHRDLKPSNVLVDNQGIPHVLDFGLAKELDEEGSCHSSSLSLAGQFLGTLPYSSPEQARGDDEKVDVRSDIYTLGLLTYRLITDSFPYPVTGTADDVRASIISREPKSAREAFEENRTDKHLSGGDISRDLDAILLKCLAKEKNRRYMTVDALVLDFERYLSGEAVEARVSSGLYQFRKAVRRHRVPFAICGGLVLLLGICLGVFSHLLIRAQSAESTSALRTEMSRLNNLDLLGAMQDFRARSVQSRSVPANPELWPWVARYHGPSNEPDGEFEALANEIPGDILHVTRHTSGSGHSFAAERLNKLSSRLDVFAERLAASTFAFGIDLGDESTYLLYASNRHLPAAQKLCQAFLARAQQEYAVGEHDRAAENLAAARNLAVDLSDSFLSSARTVGLHYRCLCYEFLLRALEKHPRDGYVAVAMTDPPISDTWPVLLRTRLVVQQTLAGAFRRTSEGVEFLDLDRLDDLTGGIFTGDGALTPEHRHYARYLTAHEIRNILQEYFGAATSWEDLTFHELDVAIAGSHARLTNDRQRNPVLFLVPPLGNHHRMVFVTRALARACRVSAFVCGYQRKHGKWPTTLLEALPASDGDELMDPITGQPFAYTVLNGRPVLRSSPLHEDVADSPWFHGQGWIPFSLTGVGTGRLLYFPLYRPANSAGSTGTGGWQESTTHGHVTVVSPSQSP